MGLIVDGKGPGPIWAIWEGDEVFAHFKVSLASGTKQEDVKVGIQGGKLVITIEATSSHSASPSSASSSLSSLFSFLKKKEEAGDTCNLNRPNDGKIEMNFGLPVGVDPDGFSASMDDAGVLTITFKRQTAFDLRNVTMGWEHAKGGFVDFKAYLAAGTKIEDLVVVIERGKYLIVGVLQKKELEGDISVKQYDGKNFRSFLFPDGVDPFSFSTSVDDSGVLTLTFTILKPNKKLVSKSKLLGGLARVVPACLMIGCEISDKISGDDFF